MSKADKALDKKIADALASVRAAKAELLKVK